MAQPRIIPIVIRLDGGGQAQTVVVKLSNAFRELDSSASSAGNGGLTNATRGMTGSVLAANLLHDALRKAFDLLKEGIIDTTLFAGRTDEVTIALHQLAQVNGISTQAIDKQLRGLKDQNIAGQEATQILI